MGSNSFWFGVGVDSDDARRAEGTPQRQEGQGGRAGQAGRGCLGGSAPAEVAAKSWTPFSQRIRRMRRAPLPRLP